MEFILLLLAIVAMVWAPVVMTRLPLVTGALVFLLLANCASVELLRLDIGPINMSLDRFFLLALALTFVVQRRLGRTERQPLAAGDWLLLAFVGWVTLSTFTHDWRGASIGEIQVIQHLINGYLTPLAIYWVVRQAVVTEQRLRGVYLGAVLFGVYLAITGLCEVAGQWSFVFPGYIADPKLSIHFGRARGPMVHAVTYGMTLAACLVCGWALWPRVGRFGRTALIALAPLALAGVFFSYTRSVWLGTALALATCIVLTLPRRWAVGVLGGLAMAGLIVVATKFERIMAFDRTDNTAAQTQDSVAQRGSFAYVSWKMFQDAPLIGVGFGQFPREKLPHLADRTTPLRLETIRPMVHHNTYLSILTELGLIGLALFIATLAAWGVGAWKLARAVESPDWLRMQGVVLLAILGVYVVQCLFHEMSFSVRDNSLIFFFAGLTHGMRLTVNRAAGSTPARVAPAFNWLPWSGQPTGMNPVGR